MSKVSPLFLLLCIATITGCGTGGSTDQKTHYTYVDADEAKAGKSAGPIEDPSKVAGKMVTKADLAKLQKAMDEAKTAYNAKPSDATKQRVVDTTVELAGKTMDCGDLSPHEKYPAALRLYREALVLDPKNVAANDAADTIVAIYKQMGRPVPK